MPKDLLLFPLFGGDFYSHEQYNTVLFLAQSPSQTKRTQPRTIRKMQEVSVNVSFWVNEFLSWVSLYFRFLHCVSNSQGLPCNMLQQSVRKFDTKWRKTKLFAPFLLWYLQIHSIWLCLLPFRSLNEFNQAWYSSGELKFPPSQATLSHRVATQSSVALPLT